VSKAKWWNTDHLSIQDSTVRNMGTAEKTETESHTKIVGYKIQ